MTTFDPNQWNGGQLRIMDADPTPIPASAKGLALRLTSPEALNLVLEAVNVLATDNRKQWEGHKNALAAFSADLDKITGWLKLADIRLNKLQSGQIGLETALGRMEQSQIPAAATLEQHDKEMARFIGVALEDVTRKLYEKLDEVERKENHIFAQVVAANHKASPATATKPRKKSRK